MSYIGKEPQVGGYNMLDSLTASATADYTLQLDSVNFTPESANHLIVSLNGVIQKAGSSFTVSGSTLSFSSALTSSDSIDFVLALGNVLDIGTPSDSTISTAKIIDNAVTQAKLVNEAVNEAKLQVSNSPTNGYFLSAQSGNTGGLTWAQAGGDNTPIFAVTRSGDQSITNNSHTLIQWNSEIFDPDNTFDSTTNYRFTPAVAGYYMLMAQGRIGVQADANKLSVVIRKNGSAIARSIDTNKDNNTVNATTLVLSDTDDYFDVEFYQNTGATRVLSQSTENTFFAGFKIIT